MSHEIFRANHLEQRPLLCSAALGERPLQWRDLDLLLHGIEPDGRLMQMFLDGQIPLSDYVDEAFEFGRTRRRINKHRFYGLLENGATLVLNRFEDCSLAAKRLCSAVARFMEQPATSNAYVSFRGTGTFGKHWDTHDVFAIQLIGKKHWQLFQPTLPLPLSQQISLQKQHECPSTCALECVLAAGDLLYIPRGWWHQATPLDAGSLHLSVGTYPATISDYVMWTCGRQLPQILQARRGLDATTTTALEDIMRIISLAVCDRHNLAEFTHGMRMHERVSSEFHTELMLNGGEQELDRHARLTLTSRHVIDTSGSELPVNGERLRLDPVGQDIVRFLNRTAPLRLADLYAALIQYPRLKIHDAVLKLARHDVVNIESGRQN